MKKSILFAAVAAVLLSASCSQSETVPQAGESRVTFTASVPGVFTKAISDGLTATYLTYAVYDENGENIESYNSVGEVTFSELKATVELSLVTGKTYTVLFWADAFGGADSAPYTFDPATKTVTISYDGVPANEETRDAFFASSTIEVVGDMTETVVLTRPFAQLNVATTKDDYATVETVTTLAQSSMTVSHVYSTLNLSDGTVGGEVEDQSFSLADLPAEDVTINGTAYKWLSMNYLLTDEDAVDCKVAFDDEAVKSLSYTNVPIKRNYRTNIYGALLCTTATFEIVIDPAYEDPDIDGLNQITTEEELLAALEVGGNISIAANIEVSDVLNVAVASSIDLNGYTITAPSILATEDLTISDGALEMTGESSGVLLKKDGGSLTLDGVTLTSNQNSHAAVGSTGGNSTVTITNCTINANDGSGTSGVIMQGDNNTVLIENTTIDSDYFAFHENGSNLTEGSTITIKNSKLSAKYSAMYISSRAACSLNHTVTVENSTLTSEVESAIEVKKTDLTVTGSTLVSNATAQKYSVNSGGSAGEGYGVVLAGYVAGTAYEGSFTEPATGEDGANTYTLAAGDDAVEVGIYGGTELVDYYAVLSGTFTVSADGKKVKFSRGNLYWDSTNSEFALEEKQNATTPSETGDNASWTSTHVSHFMWSTDASVARAGGVESATSYATSSKLFAADGGAIGGWTVLTNAEWDYLVNGRTVGGGTGNGYTYYNCCNSKSYRIDGKLVRGLLIYPDDYTGNRDESTWDDINAAGILYLPAGGTRNATNNWVSSTKFKGWYLTSDITTEGSFNYFYFNSDAATNVGCSSSSTFTNALSIRLVTVVE